MQAYPQQQMQPGPSYPPPQHQESFHNTASPQQQYPPQGVQEPQPQLSPLEQRISQINFFPIWAPEDSAAIAKMMQDANTMAASAPPVPQLTIGEKAALHLMTAGGAEIMNVNKIDNKLINFAAKTTAMNAQQIHTAVVTRWAAFTSAHQAGVVVVDVYQIRPMADWMGSPWMLQVSSAADGMVLDVNEGKWPKVSTRHGKSWSKTWTRTPVTSVELVAADGSRIKLEPVIRLERGLAPAETPTVQKRFKKWRVEA